MFANSCYRTCFRTITATTMNEGCLSVPRSFLLRNIIKLGFHTSCQQPFCIVGDSRLFAHKILFTTKTAFLLSGDMMFWAFSNYSMTLLSYVLGRILRYWTLPTRPSSAFAESTIIRFSPKLLHILMCLWSIAWCLVYCQLQVYCFIHACQHLLARLSCW